MIGQLPIATLITLGTRDFGALRVFYRRAGWSQVMDGGEFVVFELRGVLLAPVRLAKLARDGNTAPEPSSGGVRFTIGVQVDSAELVDRLTRARARGRRSSEEGIRGRGVLLRPLGLPVRPGGQLFSRSSGPTCRPISWSSRLAGRLACNRKRIIDRTSCGGRLLGM